MQLSLDSKLLFEKMHESNLFPDENLCLEVFSWQGLGEGNLVIVALQGGCLRRSDTECNFISFLFLRLCPKGGPQGGVPK